MAVVDDLYSELADNFETIARMIGSCRSIALSGHTNPDGDAIGSALALADAIGRSRPDVSIHLLLADDKPLPPEFRFMAGARRFLPAAAFADDVDLFIALDTPTRDRLRDSAAVLDRAGASAQFDHHPSRERLADVCCVAPWAASTGDVVFEFLRSAGIPLSKDCARALLAAVMTDTGCFQYQNADRHALSMAAQLVQAGASCNQVAAAVYQNVSLAALKLRSIALERLSLDPSGRVAVSYVTADDVALAGAVPDDCEGLVDEIRCIGDVDAVAFLRETPDGRTRGNLRSKAPWLDVAAVAATFGGGGHSAAAGFTFDAPPAQATEVVVGALVEAIRSQRGYAR